jgi:hypothetical protein
VSGYREHVIKSLGRDDQEVDGKAESIRELKIGDGSDGELRISKLSVECFVVGGQFRLVRAIR